MAKHHAGFSYRKWQNLCSDCVQKVEFCVSSMLTMMTMMVFGDGDGEDDGVGGY